MDERLKEIRKALNLTQEEFGKKLGVSRGVIVNMELHRAEIKPLFIEHLCSIFNVNEDWLYSGTGDMFIVNDQNTKEAVRLFRQLTPDFQQYALSQIRGLLEMQNKAAFSAAIHKSDEDMEAANDIDAEVNSYRHELEAEENAKTLSALQNTDKSIG